MLRLCTECHNYFEDEYRSTICPHEAFPANDGSNNFTVHEDAYLSKTPPDEAGWFVPLTTPNLLEKKYTQQDMDKVLARVRELREVLQSCHIYIHGWEHYTHPDRNRELLLVKLQRVINNEQLQDAKRMGEQTHGQEVEDSKQSSGREEKSEEERKRGESESEFS